VVCFRSTRFEDGETSSIVQLAILKEDSLMSAATFEISPQSLTEKIESAVHVRTGGRIRGLQVRVAEGSIIISGRVSTYYTKQLVTHAAMEAGDELLVTNEVVVC
jgi:hypothetical protein